MYTFPAYIGIGSNLLDPVRQVQQAFRALDALGKTRCVARSPLYRSEPVGPPGQPDYINAVAYLETRLAPRDLLAALQDIEKIQGRVRTVRWGPRTLDLDILLYDNLIQDDPYLSLPHPRIPERAFVLYPLRDLNRDLVIPGQGSLDELIERCPPMGLECLKDDM